MLSATTSTSGSSLAKLSIWQMIFSSYLHPLIFSLFYFRLYHKSLHQINDLPHSRIRLSTHRWVDMERIQQLLVLVDIIHLTMLLMNTTIIPRKDRKKVIIYCVLFDQILLRFEDSYLARMNHVKHGPHFKPYTGKDYQQFKKNNGFGSGYLGFDFDNPNYKEKVRCCFLFV